MAIHQYSILTMDVLANATGQDKSIRGIRISKERNDQLAVVHP